MHLQRTLSDATISKDRSEEGILDTLSRDWWLRLQATERALPEWAEWSRQQSHDRGLCVRGRGKISEVLVLFFHRSFLGTFTLPLYRLKQSLSNPSDLSNRIIERPGSGDVYILFSFVSNIFMSCDVWTRANRYLAWWSQRSPSSIDNIDFTCRVREIHVEFNSQRSAARRGFGMLLYSRCFKLSLTIFQVRSAPDT
jgi:hypothetical protein